jgi:serine/threonine protein kinase
MPSPNSVLQNRYRIIVNLAAGGMGAVYQALDERLNAVVAVKERLVEGDEIQRAFSREASLLANLSHPALPIVTDHFFEGERQFLVMRYIEGDDLAKRLQTLGTPFPISDVLDWADQLLDALEYLHRSNPPIVHRDIKPANLKIGERGQVILLDFGLAKGTRGQMSTWVGGGSLVGFTRNYASLEQINGVETDPKSDIYSLGSTLYHLMTGSAPIDASRRYCEIDEGNPDPLLEAHIVHSRIPLDISQLLKRAMSLSRSERTPNATEMRQDLRRCLSREINKEVPTLSVADDTQKETLALPAPPVLPISPKELKFEYWNELNRILRSSNSVVRLRPINANFQVTGFIGHPQVQLFATISLEQNRFTVGLRILNRKDIYRALARESETIQAEIDSAHPDDFHWRERKSAQTVSEITLIRQPDNIRWRERWPEYLAWHRDRLESFYQAFDPRVRKFKARVPRVSPDRSADRIADLVKTFWDGFHSRLVQEPNRIELNRPYIPAGGGGKSSRSKSLGRGFKLSAQLNASKNYVDVNVTVGSKQYELFVALHSKRETINLEIGSEVEWKLNAHGESWIIVRRDFDVSTSNGWEETYEWLIKNLKTFHTVLAPRIGPLAGSGEPMKDRDIAVVKAYLCDGWSHRKIEQEILGLHAPVRGGGFEAMTILRRYGITGEHKSCLQGKGFDRRAFETAGDVQKYLSENQ